MAEKIQTSRTQKQQEPKDIEKIIRYLSNTFHLVTKDSEKPLYTPAKGANESYIHETEFAYLIHEIMMCPPCVLQKNISACNEFIDHLASKLSK